MKIKQRTELTIMTHEITVIRQRNDSDTFYPDSSECSSSTSENDPAIEFSAGESIDATEEIDDE